jgi:hypothetical protein
MVVRGLVWVLILASASAAIGQEAADPALHHRKPQPEEAIPTIPSTKQKGTSTLPESATGEYMLDETGSVIQITIDNGILDGYISKLIEGQTTALTYFFDRTTIDGNHLTFTTKAVHGIWYSFDGTIVRGDVPTKQENGFYRLKGTWVMHADADKTQSSSMVNFKSTPRSE